MIKVTINEGDQNKHMRLQFEVVYSYGYFNCVIRNPPQKTVTLSIQGTGLKLSNIIWSVNKKVHQWTFASRSPSLVAMPIAEIDIRRSHVSKTYQITLNSME